MLPGLEDDRRTPSATTRRTAAVFEAVLELLDVIGEQQPLLLILEDVHSADRSTRTFAAFLAGPAHERIAAVLTYRTDELHRRHPLLPLLAELERLEPVHGIAARPFDRRSSPRCSPTFSAPSPRSSSSSDCSRASEGNALYTEELLAAGLDGRGSAPLTLRHAFLLRIERLSDEASGPPGRSRRTPPRRADDRRDRRHRPPAASGGAPRGRRRAGAGGRDDDRLAFRHALLREALTTICSRRARRAHRTLAPPSARTTSSAVPTHLVEDQVRSPAFPRVAAHGHGPQDV